MGHPVATRDVVCRPVTHCARDQDTRACKPDLTSSWDSRGGTPAADPAPFLPRPTGCPVHRLAPGTVNGHFAGADYVSLGAPTQPGPWAAPDSTGTSDARTGSPPHLGSRWNCYARVTSGRV